MTPLLEIRIWTGALLPGLACLLVATGAAIALARRLGTRRRPLAGRLGDTAAATTLDFTIAIELVLIVTGLVIQYGLLAHALLVVHQAAYWAARAASVYIPTYYPEGLSNAAGQHPAAITNLARAASLLKFLGPWDAANAANTGTGEDANVFGPMKAERVKMAAAVACLPASSDLAKVVPGGTALPSFSFPGALAGASNLLGRLPYAWRFTDVQIAFLDQNAQVLSGAGTPRSLRASVRFLYQLKVPFARRLLSYQLAGPWGWNDQLYQRLTATAAGQDYLRVPLADTKKEFALVQASWVFFWENGYWGTPEGAKNPSFDLASNSQFSGYRQQYQNNQTQPGYQQGNVNDPKYQQYQNQYGNQTADQMNQGVNAQIAAQRQKNRDAYAASHNGQLPPQTNPPDPQYWP